MKKRHVQICLSKGKRTFEFNIKKPKRLIEIECPNSEESVKSNKLESVEIISEDFISEPEVDEDAMNYVECCDILPIDSVNTKTGRQAEANSNSAGNIDCKVKCKELKSWAVRNKISQTALEDLLHTLTRVGVEDLHLVIPRKKYSFIRDTNEPVADSSTSSNNKGIHDILAVLTQINTRFDKLEENVTQMQQNQSFLSNGQAVIGNNQQQIMDSMEKIETNVKNLEESIFTKRIDESIRRMTGESYDKSMDEVANILPLKTLVAVQEVEQKLDSAEFSQAMVAHLNKVKGTSEDVSSVIRSIFTDDLLELYNWEGRWEKQALGKLLLFKKTLRDVFQQQGSLEFEKSVRKAIERSHHRVKQKKYLQKENKKY